MMPEWALVAGAMWLGILTSISPCPLATNLAAVAFLSRRADRRVAIVWSSAAYTAGRVAAYVLLAVVIVVGVVSIPGVSKFVRTGLQDLIGPGLILTGMVVTGLLPFRLPGSGRANSLGTRLAGCGILGEFLMGTVFALAFCPVSAALYFGGLMPSVVQSGASFVLPLSYGAGTALPVLVATGLLVCGVGMVSDRLRKMQALGAILQRGSGWVLVAIGVWLTIRSLAA